MKYIISGGGTGGHIYPALAILDEIKRRDDKAQILYVGAKGSMEERLAKERGLDFKTIRVSPMPRKINKEFFASSYEVLRGLFQSLSLVKDFDPDVIIGTGGFVTGPIVLAGALRKKKTLIHEQNSLPGITNRILSKFVDRACLTYESSVTYFAHPDRTIITGNPIRSSFFTEDTKKDYGKYGLKDGLKTVLVFGGSNGSKRLNESLVDMINKADDMGFQMIIGTGKASYEDFIEKTKNSKFLDKLSINAYLDDIASAYRLADLVISSSGAISLAEISAMGLPSILIPKAYTAENHQEFNARTYMDQGASQMILEAELDWYKLYENIEKILSNDTALRVMGQNSKKFAKAQATSDIVDEIDKLIEGGKDGKSK